MADTFGLDAWVRRYRSILGEHPLNSDAIDALERELGLRLPEAFKTIASVYAGGLLGDISVLSFDPGSPGPTVASRTAELREQELIRPTDVVLAEPPDSLIVWRRAEVDGPVLWISAHDVERVLVQGEHPTSSVDEWPSLGWFLESCLVEEEETRFD
jgi:hypothetical protein